MIQGQQQGLAAQAAPAAPEQMVQEVVQMLMQGADPEQLVQQGIPVEVIQQAIQIIMAQEQQAQAQSAPPATDAGLAATQSF